MDFKQIQELIKIVNRSNIGELSIEQGDFKIVIRQKKDPANVSAAPAVVQTLLPVSAAAVQAPVSSVQPASSGSTSAIGEEISATSKQAENFITIKSPMIGTFYRSSGPDKPAFISIGDDVSVAQTVCIIEAMKLFNEIESEVKGTVVKVLVEDASPVEYDQPLFLVEPA